MAMRRSPKRATLTLAEEDFVVRRKKRVPYEFVLDALAAASPWTRPMFGCLAVYVPTRVGEPDKIAVILRDKTGDDPDNGVWLATTVEHHESLRREFPNMRSIKVFGKKVTGWQVLPADAPDFEEAALHACELVVAGDPRIGKIPGKKGSKGGTGSKGHRGSKGSRGTRGQDGRR